MKLCSGVSVPARDDRLMLMEELEPGPYEHKPPFDDPLFGRFEPHSGIRLVYVASFLSYRHHRLWSFLFFFLLFYIFKKGCHLSNWSLQVSRSAVRGLAGLHDWAVLHLPV